MIEVWDHRGNRESIDRQEAEIDQISKAVYAASELLLDKDGTVNGFDQQPPRQERRSRVVAHPGTLAANRTP